MSVGDHAGKSFDEPREVAQLRGYRAVFNTPSPLPRFHALLDNISHPDYDYVALQEGPNYFLRVVCPEGTCQATGEPHAWAGRKWRLSGHMTDGEVVQTALMATLAAVEHEAREAFAFKGAAVFSPHFDIDKLVEMVATGEALKERDHGPA